MSKTEFKTKPIHNNRLMVCAWCHLVNNRQGRWHHANIRKWRFLNFKLNYVICPRCFNSVLGSCDL